MSHTVHLVLMRPRHICRHVQIHKTVQTLMLRASILRMLCVGVLFKRGRARGGEEEKSRTAPPLDFHNSLTQIGT